MSRRSSNASSLSTECVFASNERIKRFKVNHPDRFQTLATMHLSFLMDLNDTGLEEIIGDGDTIEGGGGIEKAKTIFSSIRKKHSKENGSTTKMFGVRLTSEIIDRVFPIVVYLSQTENLQREGVFRVSGNSERQKELRERLNKGEKLDDLESKFTVNDYATVFKSFLAELPEPLLTERNFNAYVQIAGMRDESRQMQSLQLLIQLLPTENLHLLQHLLCLLTKVTNQPQTKMTAENLAILFTPHLIVPRKTPPSQLQQLTELLQGIVVTLISRSDVIFCFPLSFAHDVLHQCEEDEATLMAPTMTHRTPVASSSSSSVKRNVRSHDDADDNEVVISTMYTFTDRQASQEAARKSSTESALTDLYAHVCEMPESSRKRKLLKEFNKVHGTPTSACGSEKIRTVDSLTASIRRFMSKRRRLLISSHFIKEDAQLEEIESPHYPTLMQPRSSEIGRISSGTPPLMSTPVARLFRSNRTDAPDGVRPIDLSPCLADAEEKASCAKSRDDDDKLDNETAQRIAFTEDNGDETEDECGDVLRLDGSSCCHSDENKENSAVNGHVKRLITQQNSPSFVRPMGYISPLTCVSVTPKKSTQTSSISSSLTSRSDVITDTH